MNLTLPIDTDIHEYPPGVLEFKTELANRVCKHVADTRDAKVIQALVSMGWTPPGAKAPKPVFSSCRAAMVDRTSHWIPITSQTPRGAKMLLIHKAAGAATVGSIGTNEAFFDHWAPMPTFRQPEKE